jgi:hypothetical protein
MQVPAIEQATARGTAVESLLSRRARIPMTFPIAASPADVVGDDRHAGRGFAYDREWVVWATSTIKGSIDPIAPGMSCEELLSTTLQRQGNATGHDIMVTRKAIMRSR